MNNQKSAFFSIESLFSHSHQIICQQFGIYRSVLILLPNPSNPHQFIRLNHISFNPDCQVNLGRIVCYDCRTVEAIKDRVLTNQAAAIQLLIGGCLRAGQTDRLPLPGAPIELWVELDIKSYMERMNRIPSMSWARMMWTIASRADIVAFTGVYFSVLGGAYSSLGKTNKFFAHKAKALALRQIKLAQWLKDPILECKCWLYYAEDLLQLGKFKRATAIIKRQTAYADLLNDGILLNMCQSVYAKREMALLTSVQRILD
ncbi:hypothetical protein CLU79DRAFT_584652 [Phycomyces nitens]|nr:hypothetical protein CLU79DRAFT_584652 [Phycomyces nitens]